MIINCAFYCHFFIFTMSNLYDSIAKIVDPKVCGWFGFMLWLDRFVLGWKLCLIYEWHEPLIKVLGCFYCE